ncbi:hypothetical protein MKW92_043894 [Papaver armeniacum]|nr:hypothetical protein MKW92_043894 [Papaver armeniacum]
MELFSAAAKDLKNFDANQIIEEAIQIPARSPSPLFFISTITLVLPVSVAQLFCKISFSHFLLTFYPQSIHEFSYIMLTLFSLLSTSTIVFTVASLYASKSVSLYSTLFAIPRIFEHLMITFFYALLIKAVAYYLVIFTPTYVLDLENIDVLSYTFSGALLWSFLMIIAIIYLLVHYYVLSLWNLASVISVVEPNLYGLAAMKKSKQLLRGRVKVAVELVNLYFTATFVVGKVFGYAMSFPVHCMAKLLLGLLCLFLLVSVNLTALLVQSVFFFACKSHHKQVVDKKVLYHHLCGYDLSGDNPVAFKSPCTGSVEVQSLVKDHDGVGYQPVALNDTTDIDGTV